MSEINVDLNGPSSPDRQDAPGCAPYFCPTSGEVECPEHGGFDVCCDATERHRPVRPPTPGDDTMSDNPLLKAAEELGDHPQMVPNAAESWQNGFRWGWYYAVQALKAKATKPATDPAPEETAVLSALAAAGRLRQDAEEIQSEEPIPYATTGPEVKPEKAEPHPAVRVVAEILSARLDMERWERDGWPTVDDDLAAAVAPAFLRWLAGQFEARGRRQAVGGGHPAYLTTVASGWYAAAAAAGMWADEIEDAIDAEAARRALTDSAPSVPLDEVLAEFEQGAPGGVFCADEAEMDAVLDAIPPATAPKRDVGECPSMECERGSRAGCDGLSAGRGDNPCSAPATPPRRRDARSVL